MSRGKPHERAPGEGGVKMGGTPKQLYRELLQGRRLDRFPELIPINPPVVGIMEESSIYWPDAHRDADLMGRLAYRCQEILRFNAVSVPFDMTVEAEALGCRLVWSDSRTATPQVVEGQNNDEGILDFDESLFARGRFPVVIGAVRHLASACGDEIPVTAFCEGPFTLASLLFDTNRSYRMVIRDSGRMRQILDRIEALIVSYIERLLAAGADTVIVLDPNVMGLTVSQFTELVLPCYRSITERIENPLILHICGSVGHLLGEIAGSGFAAFSFEYPAVEPETIVRSMGASVRVIGSVPTISHLLNGTPDDVYEVSTKMIAAGVDVLAPSCFTPPGTSIENLIAMRRAIEEWKGA
jgi:[methyl-Co(III) methanol-specific corrinoid protein]:coenzyme M methyltransferase